MQSYEDKSIPIVFINPSEDDQSQNEESDDLSMIVECDRSFLRTPHPKKYLNDNDEKDERHYDRTYFKKSDFNLTTRDISFISGDTCENKNFRNPTSESSLNKKNLNLHTSTDFKPLNNCENVSDYFINFKKIKMQTLNKRETLEHDSPIRLDTSISDENPTPEFNMLCEANEKLNVIETFSNKTESQNIDFYSDKNNKALCHALLPFNKIDNEECKIRLISDMKIHKYNTDTHKFILFRKRKCNFFLY